MTDGQTVELGFTSASTAQTLSGTVELSGSGTATTIKVSSGTAGGDYNDEQVFSGQVTGTETLVKSGVGRLKLSNSGNNFTNSGDRAFKLTMEPWLRLTRMLWVGRVQHRGHQQGKA